MHGAGKSDVCIRHAKRYGHGTMLTLPNILTLSRIFAVPLLVGLLWWPDWPLGYGLGFAMYCLMGVTDYFDGYLARAQGTVSKMGIFLDPIADKIMVAAVVLVLAARGVLTGPYVGSLHVIAGLVILVREIAVSGLREFLGGLQVSVPVSKLARTSSPCLSESRLIVLPSRMMEAPAATGTSIVTMFLRVSMFFTVPMRPVVPAVLSFIVVESCMVFESSAARA